MSICICSSCFIRSYLSICGHGYGSKSKTQKTPFFITQFFYNLPIAILMDIFMVCQTINHQLHIQISLRVLLLRFQYISSCLLAFISYLLCHWFCIQLKLLHTLTFGLLYLFSLSHFGCFYTLDIITRPSQLLSRGITENHPTLSYYYCWEIL